MTRRGRQAGRRHDSPAGRRARGDGEADRSGPGEPTTGAARTGVAAAVAALLVLCGPPALGPAHATPPATPARAGVAPPEIPAAAAHTAPPESPAPAVPAHAAPPEPAASAGARPAPPESPARAASAQEKSYSIATYTVDLEVRTDGSYAVAERITFRFEGGDFSEAHRTVPLSAVDSVTGVEVTSPDVEVRDVRTSREDGQVRVRWGFAPTRGEVPFTVSYRAHGAIQEENGRNVVHWTAVGDEWTVPIDSVQANVILPGHFVEERDSLAVEPADDATVRWTIGLWVAGFSHGRIEPSTTYAVRVAFPKVMAGRPAGARGGRIFLFACLAGLIGLLPGLYLTWRWTGPDAGSDPARVRGEPDLPLPFAARLLEVESLGGRRDGFLPALIVDLARRGHVRLERHEEDALIGTRKVVRARVAAEEGADGDEAGGGDDDLSPLGTELLERLARHESLRAFRKEEKAFRRRAREEVAGELAGRDLVVDRTGRSRTVKYGAAGAAVAAVAAGVAGGLLASAPLWELGGLLLGGAVGLLFAAGRTHEVTAAGAEARGRIRAHLDRWTERIAEGAEGGAAERREAARLLVSRLPWLLLEGRFVHRAASDLDEELEGDDAEILRPAWIRDLTGEEDWTAANAAAAAVAASPVSGGTATAGAGAGTAGAAGGGGGGAA